MRRRRILVLALGLAGTAMAAHADAVGFDVKPGLWEVTTTGKKSGVPHIAIPPQALAQMSPEQRAQLQKAMRQLADRQVSAHTIKSCLTAEKLRRGPTFDNRRNKTCRADVVRRTATEIEVRETCRDERGRTLVATVHLRTATPEKVVGTTEVTIGEGADAVRMHGRISATWVGPDCGAIK